jgi:NAD(P)-dependent dehydrogenase (short-subunit alcohol dehydrogenase family)
LKGEAMTKDAVVTGASTGIGRSAVKALAADGWRVFAGVRKSADAESLRQEFGDKVVPLIFDVTDAAAVRKAADEVRAALGGQTLKGLVNNAGMALGGPLAHQPVEEIRRVFEVNVLGAVVVSQAFIPLLGADRALTGVPGRIVNITSVAGKLAGPFLGDYAMSKHALEAFTDSLRRELMIYGVDVIAIGPGAVVTPIWDKAESADESRYANTDYATALKTFKELFIAGGRKGLPADRLGEMIRRALTDPKPRARYAVVPNRFFNWTLPTLLPKRALDRLIAGRLGLTQLSQVNM